MLLVVVVGVLFGTQAIPVEEPREDAVVFLRLWLGSGA